MKFTVRFLFVIITLAAIAFYILLAAPLAIRVFTMAIAALVLPSPLVVLFRHGGRYAKAFALGSLVTYAAWLFALALPLISYQVHRFLEGTTYSQATEAVMLRFGLYSVWYAVPLGGVAGLLTLWLIRDGESP